MESDAFSWKPDTFSWKSDVFFSKMDAIGLALTFNDLRLKTGYSETDPSQVDIRSRFSRNVPLEIPIISSPMDTVTEHEMAIAMAMLGGLGIIHRGLSPEEQAKAVAKVKFHLNCLIERPVCFGENDRMEHILSEIEKRGLSFRSFPILDGDGKVTGILTSNDFEFCSDAGMAARDVMSNGLVSVEKPVSPDEALTIMRDSKKKVLPVIDGSGRLAGMYVFSDVKKIVSGELNACNLDGNGNLRVGVAVGTGESELERIGLCVAKRVDVVVIDTAHGDSKSVCEMLRMIKKHYPDLDVVVGNVSEGESAARLAEAGADGIKVGQGPGSICTTRIVAGIGCPQMTAVHECAKAVRGSKIPVCADGGINYSGDVSLALAAGASSVMLGSMLAGTEETPGEVFIRQGGPVKRYRGMGSLGAMKSSQASRERYRQKETAARKLVPEGVEGVVPYKGTVADVIFQIVGGLRAGMGYAGAGEIGHFHRIADFHRISSSGLGESHPHGVEITETPPNYPTVR